jgi:hypothetical protein
MFLYSKHEEIATTSGSEQHLDEIIVSTIDSEISPIHYCDNAEASTSSSAAALRNQLSVDGERNTVIRISSFDEASTSLSIIQKQQSNNPQSLDPSSAYKNSKMRRTEYSMRGIKIGCSNPSQDSAFGSMTDGELSRASSFKLSSFQSVSSPIDEGVEDVLLEDTIDIASGMKFIDSNSSCSSPCATNDNFTQSLNDLNLPGPSSTTNSLRTSNIKETCIYLDPQIPKLMVNDGNYIYTSSPIRKCATSEVFSQKYRVSSFEDMSSNSNHLLRSQVCKKQSRSFEEEQRIESAFTPITSTSNSLERREKRKSTRSPVNRHFTATMTGKERSIMWKDSFLKCNKNNITIKSNESICDLSEETDAQKRSSVSISEVGTDEDDTSVENSSMEMSSTTTQSLRKFRNDRLLFNLAKFKQNAIAESVALDTLSESSSKENKKHSNSSSSNDESNIYNATITSTTNDECNSEEDCSSLTESLLKTPSIEDVRKFVKSFDSEDGSNSACNSEAAPLLGIEMLSISSSTDPE